MKKMIVLLSLLSALLQADIFVQGGTSVGVKLGSASIGYENYTIAGANVNYFVVDNLALGAGYEYWFSGNPDVQKITLEGTYYIPLNEKLHPYVGVFGRRILLDGADRLGRPYEDVNAYGYRLGLAFSQDRLLFAIGMVQEVYDQDEGIFSGDDIYMEALVGITF